MCVHVCARSCVTQLFYGYLTQSKVRSHWSTSKDISPHRQDTSQRCSQRPQQTLPQSVSPRTSFTSGNYPFVMSQQALGAFPWAMYTFHPQMWNQGLFCAVLKRERSVSCWRKFSSIVFFLKALNQGCQKYGPRVWSGPWIGFGLLARMMQNIKTVVFQWKKKTAVLIVSTWCRRIISDSQTNSILGLSKSAQVQPLWSCFVSLPTLTLTLRLLAALIAPQCFTYIDIVNAECTMNSNKVKQSKTTIGSCYY